MDELPLGPLGTLGRGRWNERSSNIWSSANWCSALDHDRCEIIMYHFFKVRGMSRISIFVAVATIHIYNIYIHTYLWYIRIYICIIIYTYIHYIDVGLTKHGRFTSDFRLFFGQDDWDAHGCRFGVRSINSDHFSEKVGNTINGPLKEVFPTWVYIKYIFRPIKPIWSK